MSIILALIPIAIAAAGTISTMNEKNKNIANSFILTTQMKDSQLLEAALKNYGCQTVVSNTKVDTNFENTQLVFEPNEQGEFEALFIGNIDAERAQVFISDLHNEYLKLLQQQVYQKLTARAEERGMYLETEEIKQDNSILLTFSVREGM